MPIVDHEIYDTDTVEAVGVTFVSCVFFDCQFVGGSNKFIDCRFRDKGTPALMRRSVYRDCIFDSNRGT